MTFLHFWTKPETILQRFRLTVVLIVSVLVLLTSGCASFQTASYDVERKPDKDIILTNFRMKKVKGIGDERLDMLIAAEIADHLKNRENDQDSSLMEVPYNVLIAKRHEFIHSKTFDSLGIITLGVCPSWWGWRDLYDISVETPGGNTTAHGVEKHLDVKTWLFFPLTAPLSLIGQDPGIDFRSGSLAERIANAAFDSLTKTEYAKAVVEIRKNAELRKNQRRLQSLWESLVPSERNE